MRYKYKDIDINYEIKGNGNTITLLHGFLHSSIMWNDFVKEWSKNLKVISIDLPSHGESGIVENISISEMAEIVDLILQKEKIDKTIIIGHSLGGYVGLAYAELYPSKIHKLILLNSSAYPDNDEVKKKRNLWIKIIMKHPSMFIRSVIEYLYTKENLVKHLNIIENNITFAKRRSKDGYIEVIKAMRDRPDRIHILESKTKVFMIAGFFDKVIEKEISQRQIEIIGKKNGFFLEKSAHMGFYEEKENCYKILTNIIQNRI